MVYEQRYRHQFTNVENKTVTTMITDLFSRQLNIYNIAYTIENNGDGTQTVLFTFQDMPVNADAIRMERSEDGGATYIDATSFPVSSPLAYTVPEGNWLYLFVIEFNDGSDDEVITVESLGGFITELQPAGDPLHLEVIDNDRKKYGIKGLQLRLKFLSSSDMNLKTLLRGVGSDRRYYVETWIEDEAYIIFRGYLSLADSQDSFLPHPNVVSLTATDGLGFLKKIPLTDFTNETPRGHYKIMQYIAWCLAKTGIEQNINAVMNIREETDGTIDTDPAEHFYETQYLDAKTFEKEVSECEDCYTVLQKILGKINILGQRHGTWWIKNTDEYDAQPDYVAVWSSTGDYVAMREGAYYDKEIGIDYTSFWSQERTIIDFSSPQQYFKSLYRYQSPKEVPCNNDISRGDYIADIDATSKKYALDCWTLYENRPNVPSTTAEAFIKKVFNAFNVETERYAVIGIASALIEQQLASEFIPVHQQDKIDLNFSVKHDGQIETAAGTVTGQYGQIRLYGDDGTYYTLEGSLNGSVPVWVACTSSFDTNQKFLRIQFDGTEDDTEWRSVGIGDDCPPIPKNGKIQIVFCHQLKVDQFELHIGSISFDYNAYINGSYQKFTGQSHKITQSTSQSDSLEEEVYVSDSPKKLFKGALKKYVGGAYVLSGRYWNAAVFPTGVPSDDYYHPYGYIEAFNVWNQAWRLFRFFSGSVQNIDTGALDALFRSDIPTIFHTYYLRDSDEHTNNKKFMLLDYDMDLKLCELSRCTPAEVHDTAIGKRYNDSYEFKYITE